MEQLTLDFEYLINEVIRHDAEWAAQFCSVSDYDVVILEVGVHTRTHSAHSQAHCCLCYFLLDVYFNVDLFLRAVLQVCPETNTVMISIGLLLLAFPNSDEEHCRCSVLFFMSFTGILVSHLSMSSPFYCHITIIF